MHATSVDGITWEKQPQDTFFAAEDREDIEQDDWRDPFVFYQEEEQKWWMLLCTRKKEGPSRRRGATGLLTSDDLVHWSYEGSYWDPHMCWCPECPDLFQWGEYWYFIYSTFCETQGLRTYYRISKSSRGPWKNPGNNCFDGRAFYAGKTASDGKSRYIFEMCIRDRAKIATETARKYGLPFISLQNKFDEAAELASNDYWLRDGIHPTAAGHEIIRCV